MSTLLDNSVRRGLHLTSPDGAVSIRYWGEELLGSRFRDYLDNIVEDVRATLPGLLRGDDAHVLLYLAGVDITLKPRGDRVVLEVGERQREQRRSKYVLPLRQFVREWELMSWRLAKTYATLRGGTYGTRLETWRGNVDAGLEDVLAASDVEAIVNLPLETVLLQSHGAI